MRMFTKMGVTAATGALPVLLWAGAAGAQQSPQSPITTIDPCQSQSQSQSQQCVSTTLPNTTPRTTGGGLARTGDDSMLPLTVGGVALVGAVAVRRGLRRRSAA